MHEQIEPAGFENTAVTAAQGAAGEENRCPMRIEDGRC